jgi:hypothetical protein
VALPSLFACRANCFTKELTLEHAAVESLGEGQGGRVVHRPTGGDYCTHAHADELHAEVCRQGASVEIPIAASLAQMAAVDEHQFGHPAHLLYIARRQEGFLADHHARNQPLSRRRGLAARLAGLFGGLFQRKLVCPMPGQMEDAPRIPVQGLQDGSGILVDAVTGLVATGTEKLMDSLCFASGARQVAELVFPLPDVRVADHEGLWPDRIRWPRPEVACLELP